jgi:hypothetical protein
MGGRTNSGTGADLEHPGTDTLHAGVGDRESFTANVDASAHTAGRAAQLREARRLYAELVADAIAVQQGAEAELDRLVADRAGLDALHAGFVATFLADARRAAVSRETASILNKYDPMPSNPLGGRQSRQAFARDWRGVSFDSWLSRVHEQWAHQETATVSATVHKSVDDAVAEAERAARAQAETTEDGKLAVEMPESFMGRYRTQLERLDHPPTASQRRTIFQRLASEETGGHWRLSGT